MEKKPKQYELPHDIMYDILLTSRVKTLSRFKCVCKAWNSLISSSTFQQDHYTRCSNQYPLILTASWEKDAVSGTKKIQLSTFSIDKDDFINKISTPAQRPFRFLTNGSCLGLVCIGPETDSHYSEDQPIFLCNPSTDELLPLPQPTKGYRLLFTGLGYAASTMEVKVVIFITLPDSRSIISCEIFTFRTNVWRAAMCPPLEFLELFPHAPFVEGALHFMPYRVNTGAVIYAFDIDSEQYQSTPLPEHIYQGEPKLNYLIELRGSLYLVLTFKESAELWRSKHYKNREWVKEYIIDLNLLKYMFPYPLAITRDGHLVVHTTSDGLLMLYGKTYTTSPDVTLYSYNPQDKIFTPRKEGLSLVGNYVESFLPLGSRR